MCHTHKTALIKGWLGAVLVAVAGQLGDWGQVAVRSGSSISDLLQTAALLVTPGHPDRGLKLAAAAEAAGERFGINVRPLLEILGVGVRETLEQATHALGRRGVRLQAAGRQYCRAKRNARAGPVTW